MKILNSKRWAKSGPEAGWLKLDQEKPYCIQPKTASSYFLGAVIEAAIAS